MFINKISLLGNEGQSAKYYAAGAAPPTHTPPPPPPPSHHFTPNTGQFNKPLDNRDGAGMSGLRSSPDQMDEDEMRRIRNRAHGIFIDQSTRK